MANPNWKVDLLRGLLIVAAGLWVFAPSLHGDWLMDDDMLITSNANLHSLRGLWRIWFTAPDTDYWPLTWSVLWVEWHLWGDNPFAFHLATLVFHLSGCFLIWRLLGRLGLRRGWLGGLLFAIHPLAVESVAWIAEIKNTISIPLFLLSLDAYLDLDEGKKNFGYWRCLLFYLAAMLSKTSVVMLPVVLLLYAWWKHGKITGLEIKRTAPFFGIAFVLGLITLYFQHTHTPSFDVVQKLGVLTRLIGTGPIIYFYLGKFLLPVGLLPIYPRWSLDPPSFLQLLTLPLLAFLCLGLWFSRTGWGRHLLLGLGFFCINLFPVSGVLPMAWMNISWVADHLVALPMIGLIGLAVAGWEYLYSRAPKPGHPYIVGVLVTVLSLLMLESHWYAGKFISQEALWAYAVEGNPTAWQAQNNLGNILFETGRLQEAIGRYGLALKLNPRMPEAHNNLGRALRQQGKTSEAIEQYKLALKCNPHFIVALTNLGDALVSAGRGEEAISYYEQALLMNSRDSDTSAKLAALRATSKTSP